MELVDVYNDRHEKLDYTKERKSLENGENRLSCFIWVINDKDEILLQQRLASKKKCPICGEQPQVVLKLEIQV